MYICVSGPGPLKGQGGVEEGHAVQLHRLQVSYVIIQYTLL